MRPRVRRVLRVAFTLATLATLAMAAWIAVPLPASLTARPPVLSLALEDRFGQPLRVARAGDGSRAGWIALDDVDPQLIQAFVALEDRRFFRHHGVDARAVARAAREAVRARHVVSGASTITMQVARLLRPEAAAHGVRAKLAQALWALRLEAHLTKQDILEQYLNRVPLGQGAVGVSSAAALYFGAPASHLSLGQAALLAGLASAPSALNPIVAVDRARARRAVALRRMVALGYAPADAASRAGDEPLGSGAGRLPFLAPHFTSQVLRWAARERPSYHGVLRTSLDLALQAELEEEVRATVTLLRESEVREAAAVVLDNHSGEILAWVGSPDFWSDTAGQVDMVASPRQPGSALKPFLYALAFERGVTAATILPDIPRTYRTATGPYQPRNYDRRFHGPVRARDALASSFNVPAVELTDRYGAGALLRVLTAAGFHSLQGSADHYGLGLSLGNGDVTLIEMANAYRGLAAGGQWRPVRWTAAAPGGADDPAGTGRPFAERGAALLVLDVLTDPVARIPGFGTETPFDFPFPVAVKTGTSHHFTDNWAVGVTERFTVAVWAGNFSGRPMRQVSGVTGAGPLLHRAVLAVARRYEPGVLPSPADAGARRVRICRVSGEPAGASCPGTDEWFLPGTAPLGQCRWHEGNGAVRWPAEYAEWAEGRAGRREDGRAEAGGQAGRRAVEARASADAFRILSPKSGDRYAVPPGVDARYATIALRAAGAPHDAPVLWQVDGRPLPSARWQLAPGVHAITATAPDGSSATVRVEVR